MAYLGKVVHVGEVETAKAQGMRHGLIEDAQALVGRVEGSEALAHVHALQAELALVAIGAAKRRTLLGVILGLPEHVEQPGRHDLNVYLGPFTL